LIISSSMLRAKETAEIIAKETGAEIIFDDELRERHAGEADGMPIEEAREKYGNAYSMDSIVPGSEGYNETELRAWKTFAEHKKNHHYKNVIVVSHGSIIRTLRKRIMDLTPDEMFALPGMKNAEIVSFELDDACKKCGHEFYEQDPDTLDTWFS